MYLSLMRVPVIVGASSGHYRLLPFRIDPELCWLPKVQSDAPVPSVVKHLLDAVECCCQRRVNPQLGT